MTYDVHLADRVRKPMEMTGREIRGWLHVDGLRHQRQLARWIAVGTSAATGEGR